MSIFKKSFMVGLVVLFFTGCSTISQESKFVVGSDVPYTKFMKMDGNYILTDDLKAKTSVVVFWATWCHNSRPVMQRLNEYFTEKNKRDDVVLIAVSIDKSKDVSKVEEAIKYQKIGAFQHCYSGNDVYDESYMAFDAGTLPHIFVIDPNGKIVAVGHKDSVVYEYFGVNN